MRRLDAHAPAFAILRHRKHFTQAVDVTQHHVAAKGSVSLEGVSLTVNDVQRERFGINIIRHTAAQTTLGAMAAGRRLNMEVDMLARYVERQITARFKG